MAEDVLKIAARELGNTESPSGSNRTKYGAWYGLDGNPWCMLSPPLQIFDPPVSRPDLLLLEFRPFLHLVHPLDEIVVGASPALAKKLFLYTRMYGRI